MSHPFAPGDKVVCIDDSPHTLTTELGRLTKGMIYCVDSIHGDTRFPWVRLVGDPYVINPVTVRHPPVGPHVWGAHRFRRAWEQKVATHVTLVEDALP